MTTRYVWTNGPRSAPRSGLYIHVYNTFRFIKKKSYGPLFCVDNKSHPKQRYCDTREKYLVDVSVEVLVRG